MLSKKPKSQNKDLLTRRSALEAFKEAFKDDPAHLLPSLLALIPTKSGQFAFYALTAIQANCKFYNYNLFHSLPVPTQHRESEVENPPAQTTIYNIDTLNASNSALNLGGTIHGNQSSTQNREPDP